MEPRSRATGTTRSSIHETALGIHGDAHSNIMYQPYHNKRGSVSIATSQWLLSIPIGESWLAALPRFVGYLTLHDYLMRLFVTLKRCENRMYAGTLQIFHITVPENGWDYNKSHLHTAEKSAWNPMETGLLIRSVSGYVVENLRIFLLIWKLKSSINLQGNVWLRIFLPITNKLQLSLHLSIWNPLIFDIFTPKSICSCKFSCGFSTCESDLKICSIST